MYGNMPGQKRRDIGISHFSDWYDKRFGNQGDAGPGLNWLTLDGLLIITS